MEPLLERIWVGIPPQSGLLPYLWNFRVQLLEVGGAAPSALLSREPLRGLALHRLGLGWIEALAANRRQGTAQVLAAVRRAAEGGRMGGDGGVGQAHAAFSPENIFWDPDGTSVEDAWRPLWEDALRLGWRLLAASERGGPEWSGAAFCEALDGVRAAVHGALFPTSHAGIAPGGPAAAEAAPAAIVRRPLVEEDEAISRILGRIAEAWRGVAPAAGTAGAAAMPAHTAAPAERPPETAPPGRERDEDDVVMETVILGPGVAPVATPVASAGPASPPAVSAAPPAPPEDAAEDELAKTVVLDTRKVREKGTNGRPQ
jgi:hypothetical protein